MYDAFARGDVGGVLSGMDPQIVWNEAEGFPYADGNPYVGPNAIVQGVFMRLATEWDGFAATPSELLDAGGAVVALGRYTGVYKRTGAKLDAQFAHVWRLSDGKAVRFQQYTDTAQAARAVA
jgi:uncharacterized protein